MLHGRGAVNKVTLLAAYSLPRRQLRKTPIGLATRRLLTIGFDAKGVPISMFTVNSWVTGDRMLSAWLTAELLGGMVLETGNPEVDGVLESLAAMYQHEIGLLLASRDASLMGWESSKVLSDEHLELLSEFTVDVDAKLSSYSLEFCKATATGRQLFQNGGGVKTCGV